jgi:hypothetical protein
MSTHLIVRVLAVFAVVLAPGAVAPCRGDSEDQLWDKVRRQRDADTVELRREVADALKRADALAPSLPEKAAGHLRASLSRLRDDTLLPRSERTQLLDRVAERLHVLNGLVAAKALADGHETAHPKKTPKGTGQGLGGVGAVLGLNTTVSVPDGGTAVMGSYGSMVEGRNQIGPPTLSNTPYLGRLFGNVGTGREVRGYRVLIGVRIFSLREEDERLLGQGSSR